jgi:16S rRNA (cytosine967-C5)-methyltransferase
VKEIELALEQCEGVGELADILEAHNVAPSVTLAVLPGLGAIHPDDARTPYSDIGVFALAGDPGKDSRVSQGTARVQDEGSQLAALVLARAKPLQASETILDMCAGPGGKTAVLAAEALQVGATVLAVEKIPHRAELVRNSVAAITHVSPDTVTVRVADATEIVSTRLFDRILLDAPCTGLGALRRRPEARWRKSPEDIPGLVELQSSLLEHAIALLAPGGMLAYVTCSPVVRETTEIVASALANHPEMHEVDTPEALSRIARAPVHGIRRGNAAQLWSHTTGTDAMFIALLSKTKTG